MKLDLALALLSATSLAAFSGCVTPLRPRILDTAGAPTRYEDPGSPGLVQGIGIESQDIVSMTDGMVRSMFKNATLCAKAVPTIVVDETYFQNESATPFDKRQISDRIRSELTRAANGRMVFLARHREEVDYRLEGRVTELVGTAQCGSRSRYYLFIFEMVDPVTDRVVWGDNFEVRKAGRDDVVYN